MLKSYLKTALRHLKRQPAYTTLNVVGLTVGILSSLLIVLYLHNELTYDTAHQKADRIYRVSSDISEPDDSFRWAVTQYPLGRTLKEEFGEVEQYVRLMSNNRTRFTHNNINYYQDDVYLTDSTVFDIFSVDFIAGEPESALDDPNSIVLTEDLAKRIYKGENPMGQVLEVEDMNLKITGIYRAYPENTHIQPMALISAGAQEWTSNQNWGGFSIYTYVLLKEGVDYKVVEQKLNEIIEANVAPIFDRFNITIIYEMINIRDIHLYSTFEGEPEALGDIKYIYIFTAIGIFLVLIACINYMNLATARSMRRSLEVGIRKVMGAQRQTLISQFIMESLVITITSALISFLLLFLVVPILNNQLSLHLDISHLASPLIVALIAITIAVTALISGSYPAFYLSAFRPVAVLKGNGSTRAGNRFLRRTLVGIQFAISIFMLLGTLVIYGQMQFLRNKDLGFDKDQVMRVHLAERANREKYPVFKNKLKSVVGIKNVASSTTSPGRGYGKNVMIVEQNDGGMEEYGIDSYGVDFDYFNTLSIPIVRGRNISREYPTDTATSVLVNEAMVARLGWKDPIGKRFQFDQDSTVFHKVVGVVKNFHQQSLYNPIEALLFIPNLVNSNVLIKIEGNSSQAIKSVEAAWNEVYPGLPFEYTFLDEHFMDLYEEDQLRGRLFLGFSIMMILIACLGLLGLASFIAEQRTKEISIRKVLGAGVGSLVSLVIKDFMLLVIIGAIPGLLLGYYFMNEWLSNFEYHININVLSFILVVLAIATITILTTGYHALKAASANPAEKLKYE